MMFKNLKEYPVFSIIAAFAALVSVVVGVLSLTEPMYAKVTDGRICGYSDTIKTTHPYMWKECENPNIITGYKYHEKVSKSSGWIGGGHDQNWHCTNVKREKERAVGHSIVWTNQRSYEEVKKDLFGHVTYKYHCSIDAQWGPIYKVERWKGCGEAESLIRDIKEPKTCFDDTKRIGWKWKWE